MIQESAGVAVDGDVNTAAIAAGLAADSAALTAAGVVGASDGADESAPGNADGTAGYLFSDVNGTATTDTEKAAYIRGLGPTGVSYLEDLAGFATGDTTETLVAGGTELNFDFANANQIFNLQSGQKQRCSCEDWCTEKTPLTLQTQYNLASCSSLAICLS